MNTNDERSRWIGVLALSVLAVVAGWMLLRAPGRDPLLLPGVVDPSASGAATTKYSDEASGIPALPDAPREPGPLLAANLVEDFAQDKVTSIGSTVMWRGAVVDSHDAPIAGADAWLVPNGAGLAALGFSPTEFDDLADLEGLGFRARVHVIDYAPLSDLPHATTDSEGRFAVAARHVRDTRQHGGPGFGAAEPLLVLAASGYATRFADLHEPTRADESLGSFALLPASSLTGRVIDGEGQPLAAVRVSVATMEIVAPTLGYQRWVQTLHADLVTTQTDDEGRYVLGGLWPGKLTLACTRSGYISQSISGETELGKAGVLPDTTLRMGGELSGRVRDRNGQPIAGAEVVATGEDLSVALRGCILQVIPDDADRAPLQLSNAKQDGAPRTTTDAEGRFHLSGLDGADLSLFAAAPGFETRCVDELSPGARDLDVQLVPESTLRVNVVDDATGLAVAGAQAIAKRQAGEGLEEVELRVEPLSESSTALLVRGVGFAGTSLDVWAPGYAHRQGTAPPVERATQGHWTVRLLPEAAIAGLVGDPDGSPVEGALVELHSKAMFFTTLPSTRTDLKGRFCIGSLAPGTFDVVVSAPGFVTAQVREVTAQAGHTAKGRAIVLIAGAALHGVVRDEHDRPAGLVPISLTPDAPRPARGFGGFESASSQTADEAGRYAFTDLPAGHYRITAFSAAPVAVELVAGQELEQDISLSRQPVVHGQVLAGCEPVALVSVTASRTDGAQDDPVAQTMTSEDGTYRLVLPEPGRFDVGAGFLERNGSPSARSSVRHLVVAWGEETTLDLEVPGGRVSGRAVDKRTGEPRAQISLGLERSDASGKSQRRGVPTDAEGRFSFVAVEAGSYTLSSDSFAYSQWQHIPYESQPFALGEGERHDDVRVELDRGAILRGEVRRTNGKPVKDGTEVWVWRVGEEHPCAGAPLKATAYELGGLTPGDYRVVAYDRSFGQQQSPANGVSVTLSDGEDRRLDLVALEE